MSLSRSILLLAPVLALFTLPPGAAGESTEPYLTINDTTCREGCPALVMLTLSTPLDHDLRVDYTLHANRITELIRPEQPTAGSLIVNAGEVTAGIPIETLPNSNRETTQSIILSIGQTEPSIRLAREAARIAMEDDDWSEESTWETIPTDRNRIRASDLAASPERYVAALGMGGNLLTSTDGKRWEPTSLPAPVECKHIRWTGHHFLAFTREWKAPAYFSRDGLIWLPTASSNLGRWDAGASQGDQIIIRRSGEAAISRDGGATWDQRKINIPFTITYFGNLWVGLDQGRIHTSDDGWNWTPTTLVEDGIHTELSTFIRAGDRLIALGERQAWISFDGREWVGQANEITFKWNYHHISWDGEKAHAGGFSSPDGLNWKRTDDVARSRAVFLGNTALTFDSQYSSGNLLLSENGSEWSQNWDQRYWGSTCGDGGTALLVGDHGTIERSEDGTQWETIETPTENRLFDALWDGNQFVVVGAYGTILTSPHGNEWTQQVSGTNYWLRAITLTGETLVAVGYGGTVLSSNDGKTWQ
ncbi:MAG: hypothetical protein AAF514_04035, partial [Verrucomicrobiota bacterium]